MSFGDGDLHVQVAPLKTVNARLKQQIDAMPGIVRCRDCAYIFHRKYNNGFEYQTCSYFDSEHEEVEPDGFCAWGARKEGGYD
ncbi:MAG: hypothetical protein IIZ12_03935 [Eggerthellaceae bacterium]|nr:hypothetical protein [Eggerthellaceae bacterium]